MRLVEGIGGKLLPVGPYLLKYCRVMAVFLATIDEFGFHGVNDVFLLLTHGLTQGIALTTGEVSQLARKQHHLLLIDGDAISILQILLHAGDVVFDLLLSVLTGNERGDVIHRSRAVEGIHGDEVFKHCGMQLTQVFLHTIRLKLEGTDGTSLLVEFEGFGVVDGNGIEIYVDATCLLDDSTALLHLRKRLQSKEVHLDESCRLDDMTIVLSTVGLGILEVWVVGR